MKYFDKLPKFFRYKIFIAVVTILILVVGGHFLFQKTPTYQFIAVKSGSISQTVSLTGNSTPFQSVALAFGSSGIVSNVYSALGKNVSSGQVLAALDMSSLLASLHNAQAGLTIAEQKATSSQGNLANVSAEQDALVAAARQSLYGNLAAVLTGGTFTSNPAPTITGSYTGSTDGSYFVTVYASNASNGASVSYSGLESGTTAFSTNNSPLGTRGLSIHFPATPSAGSYIGSVWTVAVPNTHSDNYAGALQNYQTALKTRDTAIANAQANVGTGDTSSLSDAEIAQAQAAVDSAQAAITNAEIVAPLSGTITQFDAKEGQLASPSTPLISIISNGGYEVDAGVSETDIGKITLGDKVSMTLDAFPNETFTGSVFYIAPSETNIQGVITFQIKIMFDKNDPRLKSGLTANIDIETQHKDNILVLPQYAILQNDQGAFVETVVNNKVVQNPVTLGISDQEGNVEVISGVTVGEQVLNIGLKAQ